MIISAAVTVRIVFGYILMPLTVTNNSDKEITYTFGIENAGVRIPLRALFEGPQLKTV